MASTRCEASAFSSFFLTMHRPSRSIFVHPVLSLSRGALLNPNWLPRGSWELLPFFSTPSEIPPSSKSESQKA